MSYLTRVDAAVPVLAAHALGVKLLSELAFSYKIISALIFSRSVKHSVPAISPFFSLISHC